MSEGLAILSYPGFCLLWGLFCNATEVNFMSENPQLKT